MKTKQILLSTLFLSAFFVSCQPAKDKKTQTIEPAVETKKETEIQKIEQAHHKAHFLSKEAIAFDIEIAFGGNVILDGTISLLTNSTKAKIELKDGNKIIAIGDKVYHSPEMKDSPMIRFHAYTWSYFFSLPYKLSDKGTVWSEFGNEKLNETAYNIQKLTFENNVGDSPDDWYYVYSNPKNHLLSVASYIVTYGKTKAKAEEDPHAIQYNDFTTVEGIPFSSNWTFWGWNRKEGLTQELGKATLKNIRFVENVDFNTENFTEK